MNMRRKEYAKNLHENRLLFEKGQCRCGHCHKVKSLEDDFYTDKQRWTGKHSICKACMTEMDRTESELEKRRVRARERYHRQKTAKGK